MDGMKMKPLAGNLVARTSREGSLSSELDDLTVIAEFDYDSDEEQVPSYYITSPYEVVGLSLTNDSANKVSQPFDRGNSHRDDGSNRADDDLDYFGPKVYNGFQAVELGVYEGLEDIGDNSKIVNEKRNMKSSGSQTVIVQNSRATSPLISSESLGFNKTYDDNVPHARILLEEIEYIKYVLCDSNAKEDFPDMSSSHKLSDNSVMLEDKFTITDSIGKECEVASKSSMTDHSHWNTRNVGTITETSSLINVGTCTDFNEIQILNQFGPIQRPALKVTSSQTFVPVSNSEVQVNLYQKLEDDQLANEEKIKNEVKYWQNQAKDQELKISEAMKLIDMLKSDNADLQELNERVNILESEKRDYEASVIEMNNRMQNVLQDTNADIKFVETKLDKTLKDLGDKNEEINELTSKLEEYKKSELNTEKIIQNLKLHLKNANNQLMNKPEDTRFTSDREDAQTIKAEHDPYLLEEISRLMQINSELGSASRSIDPDLLKKYNDLRRIASTVQTAISPIKSKLSLANKKCRTKDDLLKALLQKAKNGEEISPQLEHDIEENLKDAEHYRALSPLTITHIERLEHNLLNHLCDGLPYSNSAEDILNKRSFNSEDLAITNRQEAETGEPIYYVHDEPTNNQNLISLLDDWDMERIDDHDFNDPGSTLLPFPSNLYRTEPRLTAINSVDAQQKIHHKPVINVSYKGSPATVENKYYGAKKKHLIDYTPPPQNFRIDDVVNGKKFVFCWEPPSESTLRSSLVGYELYVNGLKKDFIPGVLSSKYTLNFLPTGMLPTTFELYSVKSNGSLSLPSKIVVHGLQKISNNMQRIKSLKLGQYDNADYIENPLAKSNNEIKDTYIAFYDYTPSGYTFSRDGVSYSELGFKTGDIIETFGEVMSNGYIFGKIRGSSKLGLIPANFIERIPTS